MVSRFAAVLLLSLLGATAARADGLVPSDQPSTLSSFGNLVADAKKTMMSDPKAALEKARQAEKIAERSPASTQKAENLATALWLEAEALTRNNQVPAAHEVLDRAIKIASGDKATTKLDGDLALSLARIADNEGNVALALKSYQKAHDIFLRLNLLRGQSIALQGLGSIYDEAHDFDREVKYYRQASQVYSTEPGLELSVANNVGFALQQAHRYGESLKDFQKALTIATSMKSPFLEAQILENVASVYAKQHKFHDAEMAADRALMLLGNDENGWAPFVWGVRAEIEYERGALPLAARDLEHAFHGQDLKKTIAPFRDMHEIAYKVYRAMGNSALALAHLEAFKRLDDQGRSLSASANLALLGAQFDFANQQFVIEHLKAEQLRRDFSIHEIRAEKQRILLISLLTAGFFFILWIGWRYHLSRIHKKAITKANVELTKTLSERNQEIERRIETEAELRLARELAEQANRAKSHFLANMGHELRTPLNAIIGFSDILANVPCNNTKVNEYAGDINASGHRLLEILNDILDMARLDAGTVTLDETVLVLNQLVDSAAVRLGKNLDLKSKQIQLSASDLVRVRVDEHRMDQIVSNLLSNAVEFTPPDGKISVAIESAPDGGVDITIADNGVGVSKEQLSRIVEPFGQVESAYARSHGGVGLGLPIVRSLVELHGGIFTIFSELGSGTTVVVHLPANRVVREAFPTAVVALVS